MRPLTRPGSLLAAALISTVVVACSSGAGGGGPTTGPGGAAPTATMAVEVLNVPTLPPLNPTPAVVMVQVHKGAIGTYLTDANGKSLYIRTTDSANTTTCTGGCVTNWPPLLLQVGDTVQAGAGVTGKLGSFKRPDGPTQVTLNGFPVYYYSGDTAAGQTNGQGINGVWFLAAPAGGHLSGHAGVSPSPNSGGGGY